MPATSAGMTSQTLRGLVLLPRLPEIAQIGRRLVLLGRHQQTVRAQEIGVVADDNMHVADAANVLHPMRALGRTVGLVDGPGARQ